MADFVMLFTKHRLRITGL